MLEAHNSANNSYCNKTYRTMAQFIEDVPLEEILKAKFRRNMPTWRETKDIVLTALLKIAMSKCNGVAVKARKMLGIGEGTFYRMMKRNNNELCKMFKNGYGIGVDFDNMLKIEGFSRYRMTKDGKDIYHMRSKTKMKKHGNMVRLKHDSGVDKHRSIKKIYRRICEGN